MSMTIGSAPALRDTAFGRLQHPLVRIGWRVLVSGEARFFRRLYHFDLAMAGINGLELANISASGCHPARADRKRRYLE